MNAFLRIEFARAFRRKWFVVSLAIGCAIALYHFFTDVLPVGLQIEEFFPKIYPGNLFTSWLGSSSSTGSYYFFFIISYFPL